MKEIYLLARRDLKQILTSPIFFFIGALSTVIWSITFLNFLFQFANLTMRAGGQQEGPNIIQGVFIPHITVVNILFIITLPALTMRLIAEEKKSRSYDLLLTAPVSATQIVVGKFIAGLGAMSALLFLALLYPLVVSFFADFTWGLLFSVFLGMFLMASLYVAAGLFASSLTESSFLAVFMGVVFNFLIWFLGPSGSQAETEWFAKFMEYINLGQHLTHFMMGSLQISSLIFFITSISFFVFLSQRVVESSRWR